MEYECHTGTAEESLAPVCQECCVRISQEEDELFSATAEGIHLLNYLSKRFQPRLESLGDPKLIMEIQGATGRSRAPIFLISSCVNKYKMA